MDAGRTHKPFAEPTERPHRVAKRVQRNVRVLNFTRQHECSNKLPARKKPKWTRQDRNCFAWPAPADQHSYLNRYLSSIHFTLTSIGSEGAVAFVDRVRPCAGRVTVSFGVTLIGLHARGLGLKGTPVVASGSLLALGHPEQREH